VKLLDKIDPSTRASAEALGYYRRTPWPESVDELFEVEDRTARTYWWFPIEALTEEPATLDEMDHYQRHGTLRYLAVETRIVWALKVGRAEELRKEADIFASAVRGMFRRKLAEMGFHDPGDVEFALRAFLKGKRVDVEHKINAPSRLLVDGKLVAENGIARDLRLTALADETI